MARDQGSVDVHYGDPRIAAHTVAPHRHQAVIPLGARQERKALVAIRETAPAVDQRFEALLEQPAKAESSYGDLLHQVLVTELVRAGSCI